jgi:molybdenum cofactor synthesis domain-containing protein
MDGFAVRAAEVRGATRLRVIGTLAAGVVADRAIGPGETMAIMTGAPIPPGADAVVIVERSTRDGEFVELDDAPQPGQHIRPVGDDVRIGDVVLDAATVVTPAVLGLLATIGVVEAEITPIPRVGVFSTGDELVAIGEPLGPGQIYDSNRATLLELVRESGAHAVDLGLVRDDAEAIRSAILQGVATCDLLVTSGGVSMGEFDLVKRVLGELCEMRWMQIAIRPAKPLAFGLIDGPSRPIPVLGLPGNPVSSQVSFELFARPAIRRLGGHTVIDRPRVMATTTSDMRRHADGKTHFARVAVHQDTALGFLAAPLRGQGSHHMASMALANGLAVLGDGEGVIAGEQVECMLLSM